MKIDRYRLLVVAIITLLSPSTQAQDKTAAGRAEPGIFALIPEDAITEHSVQLREGRVRYKATAGTLDLFGQDGERSAKVFYTAYAAERKNADRPITFVFNGGPGAASAYLHLGLVGPRMVELGVGQDDGTTPTLSDNPDSWLSFTDLVLIDPVGTGWSRAANNDAASTFYGVRQDAESLAKFIALYTHKNDRLASPKYLLGESYGGFRAAKVATALKDSQSIIVSGVLMVSPFIEGRFLFGADDDPLSAALQLPSLAAAQLERKDTFSTALVDEAERFAMSAYLTTLAGAYPVGEEATAFYKRVADLTGIPEEAVERARGFVAGIYAKQSDGGRIVSPYDAGLAVADAYPQAADNQNDDPVLDGYTRAYGAVFASYARAELGFRNEMTYTLLNEDVNRRWDWDDGRYGRSNATAAGNLRDMLSVVGSFRFAVFHGYSDALTPYGASRFVIDHLPPKLAAGRTELNRYRGGHMFYTDPSSRKAMTDDARAFYQRMVTE